MLEARDTEFSHFPRRVKETHQWDWDMREILSSFFLTDLPSADGKLTKHVSKVIPQIV